MTSPRNKRKEIEDSLIGFRLKYLLEYYKVQLALLSGTVIILLAFYANSDNALSVGILKYALIFIGLSIVLHMLIYLGIYIELRKVWYEWEDDVNTQMSKTLFGMFVLNLLGSVVGVTLAYLFLIKNVI